MHSHSVVWDIGTYDPREFMGWVPYSLRQGKKLSRRASVLLAFTMAREVVYHSPFASEVKFHILEFLKNAPEVKFHIIEVLKNA